MYRTIRIKAGEGGWGGPLTVTPTESCHKVLSVTGGGIHPVALALAELSGAEAVDGFITSIPSEETMIAVVDCGGTARCGIYPKNRIPTVNVMPVGQSGPFARFMTPDLYVSAVREKDIEVLEEERAEEKEEASPARTEKGRSEEEMKASPASETLHVGEDPEEPDGRDGGKEDPGSGNVFRGRKPGLIMKAGQGVGTVVSRFYQAGRETIDMVLKNVLPFMAFTSTLLGIITATGLGDFIVRTISPLCGTLPGMLVISIICSLPFLSPVLGPGAVIAQVVGTLMGAQFAVGAIPARYALPALFAIDSQAGADFVPVGLSLGEAEPETVEMGVPAVLISRMVTGPLAVVIAYIFSFGLYS